MSLYEFIDECEYKTAAEYYSAATLDGSFHSREDWFRLLAGGLPRSGERASHHGAGARIA